MAKTSSSAKLNMMMGEAPWQLDLKKVTERCDYLLSTGIWSDCTFVVGSDIDEEVLYGHKLILAMASPVFEAMFYGELSERHEIHIPDIQPEAFRALLAYIYTGNVQICSFNLAWDLWYAGKKYQLPHLVGLCKTYIQSRIAPKNACRAYEMARFFEDQSLMDVCIQTIKENTKEAINDSSFDDIQLNTVVTVCTLNPLNVDSELDLFHAVARYAKAQERKQEQKISPVEGRPKDDLPSKNLSISKESQIQGEKAVNGEIESCAQNKPVAVELDTKSDDTEEQFDPKQNKETQEVSETPNVRMALRKIRFLCLTPQEFAEGPGRSHLLSQAESHAIMMNISSKVGEVPMPAGFSNCRVPRQVITPAAATPAAAPVRYR